MLIVNVLATPITFMIFKQKLTWYANKSDFHKKKVKMDSITITQDGGTMRGGSKKILIYDLHYNDKRIVLKDPTHALFGSKREAAQTKKVLSQLSSYSTISVWDNHPKKDSLLIWYHPNINGLYAKEEETEMNTDGFLTQIIINSILLLLALYSILWQVKDWRKPKKKQYEKN